MKKVLLIVAVTFMSTLSFAQDAVVNKGDFLLNIGGGISGGPGGYGGYNGAGYGVMPSFNVGMEVGMFPTGDIGIVTLGGIAAMGFSSANSSSWESKYFATEVLFRGAWHLSKWVTSPWDVYAGVNTGIRFNSYTNSYDNDYWNNGNNGNKLEGNHSDTDLVIGLFIGGRWMMSDSFGLFAEFTTSEIAMGKFGVTLKF